MDISLERFPKLNTILKEIVDAYEKDNMWLPMESGERNFPQTPDAQTPDLGNELDYRLEQHRNALEFLDLIFLHPENSFSRIPSKAGKTAVAMGGIEQFLSGPNTSGNEVEYDDKKLSIILAEISETPPSDIWSSEESKKRNFPYTAICSLDEIERKFREYLKYLERNELIAIHPRREFSRVITDKGKEAVAKGSVEKYLTDKSAEANKHTADIVAERKIREREVEAAERSAKAAEQSALVAERSAKDANSSKWAAWGAVLVGLLGLAYGIFQGIQKESLETRVKELETKVQELKPTLTSKLAPMSESPAQKPQPNTLRDTKKGK